MPLLKQTCFAIACLLSLHSFAQSDTAIKRKVAEEVCTEVTKKKSSFTQNNFETQLGVILMPFIVKNGTEFKTLWNYDYNVETEANEIGRKIGQMLVLDCPAFNEIIMQFAVGEEAENKNISGTLLQISNQQFTYLLVKNKSGKEEKIWWLEYFEGSNKLQPGKPSLINKSISIQYKEIELYDAVNKEYKTYKIATALL